MIAVVILAAAGTAGAGEPKSRAPDSADSPEAIRAAVEQVKGFGYVQSAQFDRRGRQVYALWYCPFSGRAATYLHVYYFAPKEKKWIRFIDKLLEGTHDLSAEMPCGDESIVFRSAKGGEVLRESVSKIPRQEQGSAAKPAER